MKRIYPEYHGFCWGLIIPVLAVLLYSCDTYNFSHPQPVDKENIYEFPESFRGNWIDDDSVPVLVDKNCIGFIQSENVKIVKGIWPRLTEQGKYIYLSPYYRGFNTVVFDSLQKPADTILNYVINGSHIYEVTDQKLLEQGYHYKIHQDTFIVEKKDTMEVDLGQNAFLRNIGEGIFTVNIRNQVLGQESRWWQLFVMEKKENDKINIWYCSSKLTQLATMFYEKRNNYYFNSEWTSADIIKLVKQGAFEMCNQLHRVKEK